MAMPNIDRRLTARRPSHATLDVEIAEWREWWGQLSQIGKPNFGEMAARLAQFRDHLRQHFFEEESGGCLAIVVGAAPERVSRIAALQDEHRTFLTDLDRLIERLQPCGPEVCCWGQARDEFEEFLDRLNSHEEAEEELAQEYE